MAIPGSGFNKVPSRTLIESTTSGLQHPEVSTKAQYPSVAINPPPHIVLVGVDSQAYNYLSGTIVHGGGAETVGLNIIFTGLPTPLTIPAGEKLIYQVFGTAYASSMALSGVKFTPFMIDSKGITYNSFLGQIATPPVQTISQAPENIWPSAVTIVSFGAVIRWTLTNYQSVTDQSYNVVGMVHAQLFDIPS